MFRRICCCVRFLPLMRKKTIKNVVLFKKKHPRHSSSSPGRREGSAELAWPGATPPMPRARPSRGSVGDPQPHTASPGPLPARCAAEERLPFTTRCLGCALFPSAFHWSHWRDARVMFVATFFFCFKMVISARLYLPCKDPCSGSDWQLAQEWGLNPVNPHQVLKISQQIEL